MRTYKVGYEMDRINEQLRISFNLMVSEYETNDQNKYASTVYPCSTRQMIGMHISPHPYLMIEFGNSKSEWTKRRVLNLNRKGLLIFCSYMDRFRTLYLKYYRKLYLYTGNTISGINTHSDEFEIVKTSFTVGRSETDIRFEPSYIESDIVEKKVAGVCIYINVTEYVIVPYQDFMILEKYLNQINMDQLSMSLLGVYRQYKESVIDIMEPDGLITISPEDANPDVINLIDARKEQVSVPVPIKEDTSEFDNL